MNIAEGLKAARERAGMSLDDVAIAAGMAFSDVRDFECGERVPSCDQLFAISRALGIYWTANGPEPWINEPYYLEEHGEAAEWRHGAPCSPLFGVYWQYYRLRHKMAHWPRGDGWREFVHDVYGVHNG